VSRFLTERKKLLVRATVWVLIGLGICMWGAYALAHMSSSRAMLAAFFAMLVGFDRSVLIELWYWTVDSKAAVVEQIQKLGLRVQGVEEPVGNGRSPYDRISMKWLGLAASALILRQGWRSDCGAWCRCSGRMSRGSIGRSATLSSTPTARRT